MARICLTPSNRKEPRHSSRTPGTKRGEPCPGPGPGSALACVRPLALGFTPSSGEESVTVSDCWAWALAKPFACFRPAPWRCVMSASTARRQRWQNRAASSLLFFFVVVVLALLVSMAQGGDQEPAHVGEDRLIDGGAHAVEEEQQQLSRLGSRPPCCDRKCGACVPCKAVQVRAGAASARRLRPLCANYEPVGWKCRCGATVFDP